MSPVCRLPNRSNLHIDYIIDKTANSLLHVLNYLSTETAIDKTSIPNDIALHDGRSDRRMKDEGYTNRRTIIPLRNDPL